MLNKDSYKLIQTPMCLATVVSTAWPSLMVLKDDSTRFDNSYGHAGGCATL